MSMGKMIAKIRYFEWRDNLTPDENGCLDQYVDEDNERRVKLGITDADEKEWSALKAKEIQF